MKHDLSPAAVYMDGAGKGQRGRHVRITSEFERLKPIKRTAQTFRENGSNQDFERLKVFNRFMGFHFVLAIFLPWLMYMPFFSEELWLTLRP